MREQRMQFLPDLRLSTQGTQRTGRYFNQEEARISTETSQALNAGVSSSVTLFEGFGRMASLRETRFANAASQSELERARQTVVFTVTSNFLALIEQQEQLRVRREDLAAQQAQEALIRDFVEAGSRPISDLYQQQATVANARLALVQAERARELAKVDLIQTLQLDPFGSYEFQAPALGEAALPAAPDSLAALLRQAFEQRADLAAGQARLSAAEQGVRAARSNLWPTLSLSAGYNSSYSSTVDFGLWDQFDQRRGGSLGLSISVPIFDRFSTQTATERARVQRENVRIDLQNLRQEVALQVRRAALDYRAAQEQLRAAEAQREAAQLALQAARERYEVGAATLVELSQARAAQVQAASDLVSARYGLVFQERLMAYYLGELDPDEAARAGGL